jgi:hypothetical protein
MKWKNGNVVENKVSEVVSLQVFHSFLVPVRTLDAGAGQISFGNKRDEGYDEKRNKANI